MPRMRNSRLSGTSDKGNPSYSFDGAMISLSKPILTTPRLTLRPWRESDLAPFAAMNADPRVMRHFPRMLTPQESDALVARIQNHFTQHGFGNFAVEETASGNFIGFVGFN